MNNNKLRNAFTMNVLSPDDGFAPLCGAERGWGEFM